MIIFVLWLLASLFVASMGTDKTIGFGGTLLVSILFSPLVGIIVVLCSADKTKKHEQ